MSAEARPDTAKAPRRTRHDRIRAAAAPITYAAARAKIDNADIAAASRAVFPNAPAKRDTARWAMQKSRADGGVLRGLERHSLPNNRHSATFYRLMAELEELGLCERQEQMVHEGNQQSYALDWNGFIMLGAELAKDRKVKSAEKRDARVAATIEKFRAFRAANKSLKNEEEQDPRASQRARPKEKIHRAASSSTSDDASPAGSASSGSSCEGSADRELPRETSSGADGECGSSPPEPERNDQPADAAGDHDGASRGRQDQPPHRDAACARNTAEEFEMARKAAMMRDAANERSEINDAIARTEQRMRAEALVIERNHREREEADAHRRWVADRAAAEAAAVTPADEVEVLLRFYDEHPTPTVLARLEMARRLRPANRAEARALMRRLREWSPGDPLPADLATTDARETVH